MAPLQLPTTAVPQSTKQLGDAPQWQRTEHKPNEEGKNVLFVLCNRSTLNEHIDQISRTRELSRIVNFDVGKLKMTVTIEVAVTEGQRRQCTRVSLGNLYAMEWRARRTVATPRWATLAWAARLAVEMRVGETRLVRVGDVDSLSASPAPARSPKRV